MITAEYLGVTGRGKTLKAAKADAARQVRDFVKAAQSPNIFTYKGHVVIAWAISEDNASYTIVHAGEDRGPHYSSCCVPGTIQDAMTAGRRHLASNIDDAGAVAEGRERESVQRDIDDNRRFQELYRAHKAAGKSDSEAHQLACHRVPAEAAKAA